MRRRQLGHTDNLKTFSSDIHDQRSFMPEFSISKPSKSRMIGN